MAASSLLLFGPVAPRPTQTYLSALQTALLETPDLKFLVDVIHDLASIWPTLEKAYSELSTIPGVQQLDQLKLLTTSSTFSNVETLSNVVLAPLTVISQVVEFWHLRRKAGKATFPGTDNVQGFCVGFLTAAALASSRDEVEFQRFASAAIHLAVCIGAIIELNEGSLNDPLDRSSSVAVRWKSDLAKEAFERTLKEYPDVSWLTSCICWAPGSILIFMMGFHPTMDLERHGSA